MSPENFGVMRKIGDITGLRGMVAVAAMFTSAILGTAEAAAPKERGDIHRSIPQPEKKAASPEAAFLDAFWMESEQQQVFKVLGDKLRAEYFEVVRQEITRLAQQEETLIPNDSHGKNLPADAADRKVERIKVLVSPQFLEELKKRFDRLQVVGVDAREGTEKKNAFIAMMERLVARASAQFKDKRPPTVLPGV